MTEWNLGALTAPISRADVKQFRRATRASGVDWARVGSLSLVAVIAICVVGVVAALVIFSVVGTMASLFAGEASGFSAGLGFAVPVIIAAAIGVVLYFVSRIALGGGTWSRWLRLTRFAEANGLRFAPNWANPDYPGAIFATGSSRSVWEHLYRTDGRYLDLGNYQYTTGSDKERQVHRWGYIAIKLDRAVPHMVLDAKSNNSLFGFSNLPATFNRKQVLSLEGDFDRHFTLYCPNEYERDALYVFTPDLMALLIDESGHLDVEIIDDWMFAYSAAPLQLTDPAAMARLFRIIDTVGAKTVSRTDRYADHRVGDRTLDRVAPAGRRLRRSLPAIMIAVVAFIALVFGVNFLSLVSSLL